MIRFLIDYPAVALSGVVAGSALIVAVAVLTVVAGTRHDKRHVTQQGLKQRALYEDWLWARGDPRGFYGRNFNPADHYWKGHT